MVNYKKIKTLTILLKQQWLLKTITASSSRILDHSYVPFCKVCNIHVKLSKRGNNTRPSLMISDRNEKVVNTQKRSVPLLWGNDFSRRGREQRTEIDHKMLVQLKYELNSYLQKKSSRVQNKPNKDSSRSRL